MSAWDYAGIRSHRKRAHQTYSVLHEHPFHAAFSIKVSSGELSPSGGSAGHSREPADALPQKDDIVSDAPVAESNAQRRWHPLRRGRGATHTPVTLSPRPPTSVSHISTSRNGRSRIHSAKSSRCSPLKSHRRHRPAESVVYTSAPVLASR